MKQGFIIPVYNHGKTALPIAERLSAFGLPIILVDDGSDAETKGWLARAAGEFPQAILVTREKNGGKGAAFAAGLDKAHDLGLTHVLQIDADGQHDVEQVSVFLEYARSRPDAAICSYPEYDETVPDIRIRGRKIGNAWTQIVSLSGDIRDAMCGFRVYPVEPAWKIIHRCHLDRRMGFDIEILVRMSWADIPFLFYPVKVIYPEGGISHFHYVRDNARITWMFIRLFFEMLVRAPFILSRRNRRGRG